MSSTTTENIILVWINAVECIFKILFAVIWFNKNRFLVFNKQYLFQKIIGNNIHDISYSFPKNLLLEKKFVLFINLEATTNVLTFKMATHPCVLYYGHWRKFVKYEIQVSRKRCNIVGLIYWCCMNTILQGDVSWFDNVTLHYFVTTLITKQSVK